MKTVETSNKKIKVNLISSFKNLGNTCYISSVLQSLIHTLPILKLVLKQEYTLYNINPSKEAFITMNFFHILYEYTKENIYWSLLHNFS